jgi:hypothetical protein
MGERKFRVSLYEKCEKDENPVCCTNKCYPLFRISGKSGKEDYGLSESQDL